MKKCLKSTLVGAVVGALVLGATGSTSAATVSATTIGQYSGTASGPTANFYTIQYKGEAGPAITSISYDLSVKTGTYTALDGSTYTGSGFFNLDPYNFGSAPLEDTTQLSDPNGVKYTSSAVNGATTSQPNRLTFTFASGAFQANNTFSFGLDAEWVDGAGENKNGQSGGLDFGNAAIPLTITFSNGYSVTANFATAPTTSQPYRSALTVAAPAAVPLPGAVWLFGSGLVGLAGLARRRNAA
jgi:hypothetical protein